MTRILGLVLISSLIGSGAAWPKTPIHKVGHASVHKIHVASHSRRSHRRPGHRRLRAALTPADRQEDAQTRDATRFQEASGPSDHPGLFKGDHEAGWGFSNGRATAVAGLYQRPGQPDADGLPTNQVYHHDVRGAAGLSLSFKLGQ